MKRTFTVQFAGMPHRVVLTRTPTRDRDGMVAVYAQVTCEWGGEANEGYMFEADWRAPLLGKRTATDACWAAYDCGGLED